jgi:hypothetical protein
MFGAENNDEIRKGYAELLASLKMALGDMRFHDLARKGKILVLSFGHLGGSFKDLHLREKNLGYLDNDAQIARAYSAADVFILPSREDNLPNTMLEAMACGTPVLSFDVGGMRDLIVKDVSGEVVKAFDTRQMGQVIAKYVMSAELRTRAGVNARSMIEEKYSLEVQGKRYRELYGDMLKRKTLKRKAADKAGSKPDSDFAVDAAQFCQINPLFFPVYRLGAVEVLKNSGSEYFFIKSFVSKIMKMAVKYRWRFPIVCARKVLNRVGFSE